MTLGADVTATRHREAGRASAAVKRCNEACAEMNSEKLPEIALRFRADVIPPHCSSSDATKARAARVECATHQVLDAVYSARSTASTAAHQKRQTGGTEERCAREEQETRGGRTQEASGGTGCCCDAVECGQRKKVNNCTTECREEQKLAAENCHSTTTSSKQTL